MRIDEKLPGQFQAELVHAARDAFTSSFRLTSVIAAVIVSGISIMVVLLHGAFERLQPSPNADREATVGPLA